MLPLFAILLLCLAAVGCVLHGVALVRLRRFGSPPTNAGEGVGPITFWRALKPGVPALVDKLERLADSTRAEDQILLGIDADSSELEICEGWRAQHPGRDIAIVRCEPGRAANPKISKFLQMEPAARHARWILTDSEAVLTRTLVEGLRAEWSTADTLTCGYRFVEMHTVPQTLDALPAAVTLWPGLMLVSRIAFTLGAGTALRAEDLAAIGGWAALGDRLAEDHELGRRLVAAGKTVRLSRWVLDLGSDPMGFRDWWRHQHRVAVTYRAASPAGAAGLPILHTTPLALLAWGMHPPLWPWAVAIIALRSFAAVLAARMLGGAAGGRWMLAPIIPLLDGVFWLVAWLPLPVWWAGKWQGITWRGRFL